ATKAHLKRKSDRPHIWGDHKTAAAKKVNETPIPATEKPNKTHQTKRTTQHRQYSIFKLFWNAWHCFAVTCHLFASCAARSTFAWLTSTCWSTKAFMPCRPPYEKSPFA